MARKVSDACEQALTKHPNTHLRFADHFWCDALAALAQVLTELLDNTVQLSDTARGFAVAPVAASTWQTIHTLRSDEAGNTPCQQKKTRKKKSRAARDAAAGLSDTILEGVVELLVTALMGGVSKTTQAVLAPFILRLRILALLFCPDPYAHKAVWDYCLVPLLKQVMVIPLQNYDKHFYDMFKQEWDQIS